MTRLSEAWERARDGWSEPVLLGEPIVDTGPGLASIDLSSRRVRVNLERIEALEVPGALEALLAHEVGHHLRWPRDLATHARMWILERGMIPLEGFSALNLFTDLLINERLTPRYGSTLAAVYEALAQQSRTAHGDVFRFYSAIYEELWQLPAGTLLGPEREGFEERHPQYRAEAHVVAQDLYSLGPDVMVQLVFFLSYVMRYLEADAEHEISQLGCHCEGEPPPDAWARALSLGPRERRALARAKREGWLSPEQVDRLTDSTAFERRVHALPGVAEGAADLVPEVMAAWYRQSAERYLVRPPPQRRWGEAVVPTTLEPWEPGEPLHGVDWAATLREKGPALAAAEPLVRDWLADEEGFERELWQPRMEIYLDVSGSMPDPRRSRNAMTLAAQILATGTLRAGGWVRALVYSAGEPVRLWDWCRSATVVSGFLMHYIGAGTEYPFAVLRESTAECRRDRPIRVVISDSDFDRNVDLDPPQHLRDIALAVEGSAQLLLLLRGEPRAATERYEALGARVQHVRDMHDFPGVAAALSRALFDAEAA